MAAALLAGCSGQGAEPDGPEVTWSRVDLPASARVLLRGAFRCGDDLVVLGATADGAGATSPAAWRLVGSAARPLALDPRRDPYAAEAILSAGACRPGGEASVFGSKSGGAHGLPRSAMWRAGRGGLVVARNPFEVFGGPNVGSYGPMAADADGWVMVGTRTTGGAVWTSADGGHYALQEGAIGPDSHLLDLRRDGARWLAAGFVVEDGDLRPQVWTSTDTVRWDRHALPSGPGAFSAAERFASLADGRLVVVGFDAGRLATWTEGGDGWSLDPALPAGLATLTSGGQGPYVTGAAVTSQGLAVTFSDGARFRALLRAPDGQWQRLALPEQLPVSGDALVAVTAYDGRLALLLDDGSTGGLYLARR